jgi:hypothetical protein
MNKIHFIEQFCPLCGKSDFEKPVVMASDILYGKSGWFPIVFCKKCKIAYTKIIPDEFSIHYYYPSNYNHFLINHSLALKNTTSFISKYLKSRNLPLNPPASVFEIGASNGAFLDNLINLGYDAYGLEPSADKISYPSHLSSRISNCSFDGNFVFSEKYDLIIANINRNILLNDMQHYVDCLNKKGTLLPN